jgi:hypothetical protein
MGSLGGSRALRPRRPGRRTSRFAGCLHRGDDRNRTGVDGFAGRCVATPPRRHAVLQAYWGLGRHGVAVRLGRARPQGPSESAAVDRLERFPGRLAQLGERRLDKAEVTGSSPVSPIREGPGNPRVLAPQRGLVVPIWFRLRRPGVQGRALVQTSDAPMHVGWRGAPPPA